MAAHIALHEVGAAFESRVISFARKEHQSPDFLAVNPEGTVPTLLIHAEWDRDTPAYMSQTLFPLLVNAPGKRYVQLAEGTHTIVMEKNRMKLFEAVQAFLDESGGS